MGKTKVAYLTCTKMDFSQTGRVPSVVFYGADRLNRDSKIEFSQAAGRNNMLKRIWWPFERYLIKRTGIGFRLDQALLHLPKLRRQDVVVGETDSCGLPLLLLKKIGLLKQRTGFISAGLINGLAAQKGTKLFRFYQWLISSADFIVCWSPVEERLYREVVGAKAQFVLLESDVDFYQPNQSEPVEDFILCVGRDVGRDFQTLFQAVRSLNLPTRVVTSPSRIERIEVPENVELHFEKVDYETLLDWYNKARLVVVNLKNVDRITGQRALLEALGIGKATLVAATQPVLETYALKDGQDVIFYRPEDAEDLKQKIAAVYDDRDRIRELGARARAFAESLPRDAFYTGLCRLLFP